MHTFNAFYLAESWVTPILGCGSAETARAGAGMLFAREMR